MPSILCRHPCHLIKNSRSSHCASASRTARPSLTKPLWVPSEERIEQSKLVHFINSECPHLTKALPFDPTNPQRGVELSKRFHCWSLEGGGENFWRACWDATGAIGDRGERLSNRKWSEGRSFSDFVGHHFFPDAEFNIARNMMRMVDHTPSWLAASDPIITFAGEDQVYSTWTALRFKRLVHQSLGWLDSKGFKRGDVLCAICYNGPEALAWFISCQARGGIWSSVSPDFGSEGVLERFTQISPKLLVACEEYMWKGKHINCVPNVIEIAKNLPSLDAICFNAYTPDRATGCTTGTAKSSLPDRIDRKGVKSGSLEVTHLSSLPDPPSDSTPISYSATSFNSPAVILFSSGTTGKPKCITHRTGALLQIMKEHQLHLDIHPGDCMMYYTTTAWMMWWWSIAALASQARLLLYDGNPLSPSPQHLWQIFSSAEGSLFGTSAKYLEHLRKQKFCTDDYRKHINLTQLKTICSTGSPLSYEGFEYVYKNLKHDVQLASISGGTDIVSCFVLGSPISPVYPGECQTRGWGLAVDVWDESRRSLCPSSDQDIGEKGELVCTAPFVSQPLCFWGDDADNSKYKAAYFETFEEKAGGAVWGHGDSAAITPRGGVVIYGRSDTLLNPGGVRIGTAEIYRELEKIDGIEDAVVVGGEVTNATSQVQEDTRVLLFVKMRKGQRLTEDFIASIRKQIRKNTTPRHVPFAIYEVPDIVRTLTGKIVEGAVKNVIHGREVKNIKALANPEALEHYKKFRNAWLKD